MKFILLTLLMLSGCQSFTSPKYSVNECFYMCTTMYNTHSNFVFPEEVKDCAMDNTTVVYKVTTVGLDSYTYHVANFDTTISGSDTFSYIDSNSTKVDCPK